MEGLEDVVDYGSWGAETGQSVNAAAGGMRSLTE